MTLVAGVDSSTQSCKVVIVDAATGEVVRAGRAAHPDGTEVPPAAWWDALQLAIVDAGGIDDVAAISVAGQQHGMVALAADGTVIRDALLWNDTRSADAATQLIDEVGAAEYARRTNVVPVASFTATKLRWLRDHEPANADRVAAVALPHDWLTWRLRGYGPFGDSALGPVLDELTTDRSDASGTAYWSPVTGEYDDDLFERALGHAATRPRILGPGTASGRTTHGVVVGPGAGDNAAAALGLGVAAGDVIVSIGTSGTVFAVSTSPVQDPTGTVAGFADASGLYLPLVATLNAARVIDSFADLLGVGLSEFGDLALAAAPGAGGAVLLPYLAGERTPNLPHATGTLSGLTLASNSRPAIARAAIEGLLCGLADGLDAVVGSGITPVQILLIGGAAQNPAVQACAAQIFAAPVVVPAPAEYVARGAAAQAAWTLNGDRPAWALPLTASPAPDPQPHIRAQYQRAFDTIHRS